ncbi:hypothetical protein JCM8208_004295 [Rhodotorula glutinis]
MKRLDEARLTNIARLSRAILEVDRRGAEEVEQVKLYQSGVGTDETAVGSLITGALGRGMMEKVKDLYDFLCINHEDGDEIYLLGFSRGAYIVRLLATLIDLVGLLPPRTSLHLFPRIFAALDAHTGTGDAEDRRAVEAIRALLEPLRAERDKQRAASVGGGGGGGGPERFLIECVAAFDTVGTRGRPSFLRSSAFSAAPDPPATVPRSQLNSFGLPAAHVPSCVRVALQALAVDERRRDYAPVLWRRWEVGDREGERRARKREREGQRVEQVWFAGAHADVGGGYPSADLSFLALSWVVDRLSAQLAIDDSYLRHVCSRTTASWGEMEPHQSRVDEFRFAPAMDRPLPSLPIDPSTSQYLHRSLLTQPHAHLRPALVALLADPSSAALFAPLGPLELRLKREWAPPPPPRGARRTAGTAIAQFCESPDSQKAPVRAGGGGGGAEPARRVRPSSVTSFTDNESSPSSSPSSPSSPSSLSPPPSPSLSPFPPPTSPPVDAAFAQLALRRGTRRLSPPLEQHPEGPLDWAQQLQQHPHGLAQAQPPASSSTSTKRPRSPPQGPPPPPNAAQEQRLTAGDADAEGELDLSLPQLPPDLVVDQHHHRADNDNDSDNEQFVLPTPPAHLYSQQEQSGRVVASNSRVGQQQQQNAVAGPSSSGAGGAAGEASQAQGDKDKDEEPALDAPEDLPDRDAFEAGVEEYLEGLHAIKRNKALMTDSLHNLVLAILREPQNTKQGDPQMRFWVRQRFLLVAAPEGDHVVHEGKRVVLRSHLFDAISAAHVAAQHGGRDKTFAEVRKHASYVPKETVVLYIRLCPTCGGKRVTVRGKRVQGDKRIPLPKDGGGDGGGGLADDDVRDTTGILPRLLPAPAPPTAAPLVTYAADIPLDPALLAASSSAQQQQQPVAGPSSSSTAFLPSSLHPLHAASSSFPPSTLGPGPGPAPKRQRTVPRAPKPAHRGAAQHRAPAFVPQRSADGVAAPGAVEDEGMRGRPGRRSAKAAAAGISALAALERGDGEDEYGATAPVQAQEQEHGQEQGREGEGAPSQDEDALGESDEGNEEEDEEEEEMQDDEERLVLDPDLLSGEVPGDEEGNEREG